MEESVILLRPENRGFWSVNIMKILVTYKSKTGFTKKYAKWIAEELNCEKKDIKNVTSKDIAKYDLVIHGGWIFGGVISG